MNKTEHKIEVNRKDLEKIYGKNDKKYNNDYIPGLMPGNKNLDQDDENNTGFKLWATSIVVIFVIILITISIAINIDAPGYEDGEYRGYFNGILLLSIILTTLRLFLVYWIMKDSIERGMATPPGWGLFALIFPIITIVSYYFLRTDGDLIRCEKCSQKMSEILHECPRCKYRNEPAKKKLRRMNA